MKSSTTLTMACVVALGTASGASHSFAQVSGADDEIAAPPEAAADATVANEPEAMQSPPRPLWSVNAGFGFAGGGDDLVTAFYTDGSDETLTAGTGFSFSIGTTVEPFRFDAHAFGIGFDFGIKGWNIGGGNTNFQLTLTRLPIQATVQYTFHFDRGLALLVAGGLQHEMSLHMTGSGALEDVDAEFDDATGWLGEAGVMIGADRWGLDLTLRYTGIEYAGGDLTAEVNAGSIGIFAGFHYALITTGG